MITQELLKKLFVYDPETGSFTRRIDNKRPCGHKNKRGYIKVQIGEKSYSVHRLAWLYFYGVWPEYQIDHRNGITDDNRILNLRDVSTGDNTQNQRFAHKGSKSGLLGAHWVKKSGKYQAMVKFKGKNYSFGQFDTPEEAHKAYIEGKKKLHAGYVDLSSSPLATPEERKE